MIGEIAALSAAALWATASVIFTKLGREDVTPLAMNFLKCVIAVVLLALTLWIWEGRVWPWELPLWETGVLAASGIAGLTLGDTAFFAALTRIGSRRALLLRALAPPMTAVMALPILGEPITVKMVAGMTLTIGGVVWVILERQPNVEDAPSSSKSDHGFGRDELVGIALAIVAAAMQAVANVFTKLGGGDIPALDISIVRLAFGILGLGLVVGATSSLVETIEPMKVPRKAILILVATILGTYFGIWLSVAGLRYTFTGIAATLTSTSPVWVLPLAYAFEDEPISPRAVAGACLAVVGIGVLFVDPSHLF